MKSGQTCFKSFASWNTARRLKYIWLFFKFMHRKVKDSYYLLQAQQEKLYHEYSSSKHKESRDKLEHYYEQLVNKLQAEIKCIFLLFWTEGFDFNPGNTFVPWPKRRFRFLS